MSAPDEVTAAVELSDAERWAREIGAPDGEMRAHLDPLLAEYDRRGAVEARYVAQVRRVLPYLPGPDPDDQSEDFDERVVAELERLRARVAELEAIEKRADETSTWCGEWGMHRAVRYIRTGSVDDRSVSS